MTSVPVAGWISDRIGNRWQTIAGGLLPGIAGFILIAIGKPLTILFGVPITAITGGSNQGLSTALVGDIKIEGRSRRLGALFTIGDLTSAIGPPLVFALIPLLGVKSIYITVSGLLAAMFFVTLWKGKIPRKSQLTIDHH
jgi:MFS family permease